MKVWILTLGSYSDERIVAVYDDEQIATAASLVCAEAHDGCLYEQDITSEVPTVQYRAYMKLYADPEVLKPGSQWNDDEPAVSQTVMFADHGPNDYKGVKVDRMPTGYGETTSFVALGPDRERVVKAVVDTYMEHKARRDGVSA